MYATPHAAVSLAIQTTSLLIVKDPLLAMIISTPFEIFSHWCVDFLFEANLTKKENNLFEGIGGLLALLPFFFIGGYSILFWVVFYLKAWVTGNLLDIIDKKLYIAIFYRRIPFVRDFLNKLKFKGGKWEKLINYLTTFTFIFHKHKPNQAIIFNKVKTKIASVVAIAISITCAIILNYI